MFFLRTLEEQVKIEPRFFGRDLEKYQTKLLYSKVEGKVDGENGYVIAVVGIEDIGKCEIIAGRAHAISTIRYQAIVYMPFPGEVVDGVVETVEKFGIFVRVGPMMVFIIKRHIPFMEFDGNVPCFKSQQEGGDAIHVDDGIRLMIDKVIPGMTDNTFRVVGTLAGEYLGNLNM